MKNKEYWFPFASLEAILAKYLNNPSSSKNMEMIVIEKNKTNIFNGLIDALLVNCFPTSWMGAKENAKRIMAPNKAIIQYVSNFTLPILMCGNNRIDKMTNINVVIEIIIVGIITKWKLCSYFLLKTIK